jgi:hypothetical protein
MYGGIYCDDVFEEYWVPVTRKKKKKTKAKFIIVDRCRV